VNKGPFVLHDQIYFVLNNQDVVIDKAMSKSISGELIPVLVTPPTAQSRYNESFVCLKVLFVWNGREIIACRLKLLQTQSHEATNTFLKKKGKTDSSACSFCGVTDDTDESLQHLCDLPIHCNAVEETDNLVQQFKYQG